MDDAMHVWWYITWRTVIAAVALKYIANMVIYFLDSGTLLANLFDWGIIIVVVVLQILFFKFAIGKKYKNFRFVVVTPDVNQAPPSRNQNDEQVPAPSAESYLQQ